MKNNTIIIDAEKNVLGVDVGDAEMTQRKAAWKMLPPYKATPQPAAPGPIHQNVKTMPRKGCVNPTNNRRRTREREVPSCGNSAYEGKKQRLVAFLSSRMPGHPAREIPQPVPHDRKTAPAARLDVRDFKQRPAS